MARSEEERKAWEEFWKEMEELLADARYLDRMVKERKQEQEGKEVLE